MKAYLRYEAADAFGVIASTNSSLAYDASGKLLLTGALENLIVWNVKQGTKVGESSRSRMNTNALRTPRTRVPWPPRRL